MTTGYDPILSLMAEIKNALLSGKRELTTPHSNYRQGVLEALRKNGFISYKIYKESDRKIRRFQIEIKEGAEVKRRLTGFRTYSSPGRRFYLPVSRLRSYLDKHRQGLFVSTSRGVMDVSAAVKKSLGGEILFEV